MFEDVYKDLDWRLLRQRDELAAFKAQAGEPASPDAGVSSAGA
jgi:hypothetical protein